MKRFEVYLKKRFLSLLLVLNRKSKFVEENYSIMPGAKVK